MLRLGLNPLQASLWAYSTDGSEMQSTHLEVALMRRGVRFGRILYRPSAHMPTNGKMGHEAAGHQ